MCHPRATTAHTHTCTHLRLDGLSAANSGCLLCQGSTQQLQSKIAVRTVTPSTIPLTSTSTRPAHQLLRPTNMKPASRMPAFLPNKGTDLLLSASSSTPARVEATSSSCSTVHSSSAQQQCTAAVRGLSGHSSGVCSTSLCKASGLLVEVTGTPPFAPPPRAHRSHHGTGGHAMAACQSAGYCQAVSRVLSVAPFG